MRNRIPGAFYAIIFASLIPATADGQYLGGGEKDFRETQIADLDEMREKFTSLADAFPDSLYDWRPMEGVRSVRDVMALIASEGVQFPGMWGYETPEWVAEGGFRAELNRLGEMSKEDLIAAIERSFQHMLGIVRNMTEEDRARQTNFFGLRVDLATAITLTANDMHEHLGQSIAYARMNRIVPPWSR